ncbi:hypothetical protein KKC00_01800 [Patescibacteria group bacterium]|nr:hypothetical protein [Patescibacteria group bacterium]
MQKSIIVWQTNKNPGVTLKPQNSAGAATEIGTGQIIAETLQSSPETTVEPIRATTIAASNANCAFLKTRVRPPEALTADILAYYPILILSY